MHRFIDEMSYQMNRKRDEKVRHWTEIGNGWLLRRLRDKTRQLERTLKDGSDQETVQRKAAHIANFAMMITDNALAAHEVRAALAATELKT